MPAKHANLWRLRSDIDPGVLRTVWITGAGASLSATQRLFPTLLGLPARAKEMGVISGDGGYEALQSYLRSHHFSTLSNEENPVNLELVLTLIEADAAIAPLPRYLAAREDAVRLLRSTLIALHKKFAGESGVASEYVTLRDQLLPQDSVVTFNWDLLLDNALGREACLPDRKGVGMTISEESAYTRFLTDATGWGAGTIDGLGTRPPSLTRRKAGEYIKAHGSIDWFYCDNASCRQYGMVFPLKAYLRVPRCSLCVERARTLIVPPTLNKRVRDIPSLRRSWAVAAYEIAHANRLVIWGYSLPPTDFMSEWLLRQVRLDNCRDVLIINPDVTAGRKTHPRLNKDFITRFTSTFWTPGNSIRVRLFRTFAEYLNGEDLTVSEPSLKGEIVEWLGH